MDNRKIILASYVGTSMLVWFLTRSFVQYLYLQFYQIRRLAGIDVIREAVPLILALAVFGFLFKKASVNTYMEEVVVELKKVTWPSRQDVVRSTTVVIICILIASAILATFDAIWGKVIGLLLQT